MCLHEHISSFPLEVACKAITRGLNSGPTQLQNVGSPDPPVGQLVLFVCLYFAAVLKEVRQRELGQLKHPAGLTSVEEVNHIDAKVSL